MSPADLQRWEKTRQMGRTKFVPMFGITWGVLFAVLFSFSFSFANRHLMNDGMTFTKMLLFPVTLPISLAGGIVFAVWLWRRSERDYQRGRSKPEPDHAQMKDRAD